MIRVKYIEQTCFAFPSQWEGVLEDGRLLYARYRWGRLTAETFPSVDLWMQPGFETVIFNKQIGDDYDGDMGTEELLEHLEAEMV